MPVSRPHYPFPPTAPRVAARWASHATQRRFTVVSLDHPLYARPSPPASPITLRRGAPRVTTLAWRRSCGALTRLTRLARRQHAPTDHPAPRRTGCRPPPSFPTCASACAPPRELQAVLRTAGCSGHTVPTAVAFRVTPPVHTAHAPTRVAPPGTSCRRRLRRRVQRRGQCTVWGGVRSHRSGAWAAVWG